MREPTGKSVILERRDFNRLFQALKSRGYCVAGPTVREGAIVYDEVASADDLPVGWTDVQEAGKYRLERRKDRALFGYTVGPHSWKKYLHPPVLKLWSARREGKGFSVIPQKDDHPRYAFIGIRSCELHAMAIQDKVFLSEQSVDGSYKSRREDLFLVAVNCGQAGGTCFCLSMKTGPKAESGFDLALTEIIKGERHYFVVEIGSERGKEVVGDLACEDAGNEEKKSAKAVWAKTASEMGRTLDTTEIKDLLFRNIDHPQWDDIARRCLTCANCTMVCPTCFCTTVEDVTDLAGENAERVRKWDSCFTADFSSIHGGTIRQTPKSRYRQWMTHKLASWHDQFGTSGCVGCGRCITWCPTGIDITAEVRTIRESEKENREVNRANA